MFQEGALVLSQKEQQLPCNPMSNSKNGLLGLFVFNIQRSRRLQNDVWFFFRKNNCRIPLCRMAEWGLRGEPLWLIVGVKEMTNQCHKNTKQNQISSDKQP